jgi:hypothetical protein
MLYAFMILTAHSLRVTRKHAREAGTGALMIAVVREPFAAGSTTRLILTA